jgi:hypothetical protein
MQGPVGTPQLAPIAFCILPATLAALPSVSSFLSPKTFPAASFTAPFAYSAEPLIRSLSIAMSSLWVGIKTMAVSMFSLLTVRRDLRRTLTRPARSSGNARLSVSPVFASDKA